jgi:hypothetical protein
MLQNIMYAFSEITQCFMVVAVAVLGFYIFVKKPTWCDATLGKLTKAPKCDDTKKAAFSAIVALVGLTLIRTVMPGMGGGMGGGMGMM